MEKRKHGHDGGGDGTDTVGFTALPFSFSSPAASSSTASPTVATTPTATQVITTPTSSGINTVQPSAIPPTPGLPSASPQTQSPGHVQFSSSTVGTLPQSSRAPQSSTPSSTSDSFPPTSPGSQSFLQFQTPSNTTVCSSLDLLWTFAGHELFTMTLYIEQQNISSQMTTQQIPTSARVLSTNVDVTDSRYTWSPVIADPGWYIANSFDNKNSTGVTMRSSPFFIAPPMNNSCLQSTSNNSSSFNHSHQSRPSDGTIIGLSLGITAGVTLLLAAFLYPRLWRKELPSHDRNRPYLLY